jgi:uncharacterized membrane protein YebE (DUF533 family)
MGQHAEFQTATSVAPEAETAAIAALAVALLVIAPEGRIGDVRLADALAAVAGAPVLEGLAGRGLARTARDLQAELAERGPLRMLRALTPHMTPALTETALCVAARAALADGRIDPDERAMLARTAAAFGVAERTLAIILQVMAMAQRPAP